MSDTDSRARSDAGVDLLLLNASNYPRVPVYPYAFVQVSEVARRHGLRVASVDLLGLDGDAQRARVAAALRAHRPRAVGVHLRQLDSLFVEEYRGYDARDGAPAFRPVEATARLVDQVRALTDAPVLLGGHGFTSSPRAVFARVRPDLGVVGEPDGLFARFDDALAGRDLGAIPNLMIPGPRGAAETARVFYGPAVGPEYTDETVEAVRRFYGSAALDAQTLAVEVQRGCPYQCYFCCEPGVKGREARVRPLDAVFDDVARLARHGLRRFWMVCSELNVYGPELALQIAERMTRLREREGHDLRWYAFSLPTRMGVATWRELARSGFRGGFNTFQSLDDENLRAGRVPHRAIDAVEEYKAIEAVSRELPPGDAIRARGTLALFLGNAYATVDTVARTLALLDAHGLLETVRVPGSMAATRLFEAMPAATPRAPDDVVTFGADEVDLSLPTFAYPSSLVRHFGGRRPLERFLRWVDGTLLMRVEPATRPWSHFVAAATTPTALAAVLRRDGPRARLDAQPELTTWLGDGDATRVGEVFLPRDVDRDEAAARAHAMVRCALDGEPARVSAALVALGLPGDLDAVSSLPVYDLLRRLYARFDDEASAVAAAPAGDVESLAVRYVMFRRGVAIEPAWRAPLFGAEALPRVRLPMFALPIHQESHGA